MAKVHQNLAWAVAYNIVAIPVAAGALLPQLDFAMTPSLSGNVYLVKTVAMVVYVSSCHICIITLIM